MQLNHSFTVPATVDHAWEVLRDIRRIGPCMPGASIDSVDGEEFTGRVKVKVGPMQVTYQGEAAFTEVDEDQHRAVIVAKGKEARGSGTANATITAQLTSQGEETGVSVVTDLSITGRPAQFGRGVLSDVGDKLLGQFATCLADTISGAGEPAPEAEEEKPAAATAEGSPAFARMGVEEQKEVEAVNLFEIAGQPVLKRLAPVGVGLLLLWLVARLVSGRRG